MTPLSAVIMTQNEEAFIARCIGSVSWADEVLVIDSGSTDRTREIAASLGANVYQQPWLGFSGQRNRGAELARHDWIFFLDADEVVTKELARSVKTVMRGTPDARDGYAIDRRGDFLGALLPNEARPSKRRTFIRLYNRRYSAYDPEMPVHEEVRFPGKSVPLEGVLLHWNGLSMDEFVPLFNRYATLEAQTLHDNGKKATALDIFARPVLRFFWSYLARGGWRLGTRGLMHAMLKAVSDYLRYAKLWELQHVTPTPHPPAELYTPPPVIPVPGTPSGEAEPS